MADTILPSIFKAITVPEILRSSNRHPWHELIVPVTNTYTVDTEEHGTLHVTPGRFVLIPAGCIHSPCLRIDIRQTYFCFMWAPTADDTFKHITAGDDHGGHILFCCSWMWQLCNGYRPQEIRPAAIEDMVGHIAALISGHLRMHSRRPDGDRRIRMIIDHMHTNIHEQNRVDDMAYLVGMTSDGLIRLFRRELGTTPGQYLQRLRVDKAISLLVGSDQTLQQIAGQVGLNSGSHLSQIIKKVTGRRPRHFRSQRPT